MAGQAEGTETTEVFPGEACFTWFLEFETWSLKPLGLWVFRLPRRSSAKAGHFQGLPPTPVGYGATSGLIVNMECGLLVRGFL